MEWSVAHKNNQHDKGSNKHANLCLANNQHDKDSHKHINLCLATLLECMIL